MASRHVSHVPLPIRVLAILVAALTALALLAPAARAASPVDRLAGDDRVATSVAVARAGWSSAEHVLLATAVDYPDAIAAASLAASLDAPVLLTLPDALSPAVADLLGDLGTSRLTILGGTRAVSKQVTAQVEDLGVVVDRIAGENRYDTSARIARAVLARGEVRAVAIALGNRADGRDAWPDALSAATLAGGSSMVPTLLTASVDLPAETAAVLADIAPERAMVLGGKSAIGDRVVEAVAAHAGQVDRLRGPDRYDTAISVAEFALSQTAATEAVFVSGEDFADALSAGALAVHRSAPLLLVPESLLDDEVDAFLRSEASPFDRSFLVGGAAAVTAHVEGELVAAMTGEPRPAPPPPTCPPNSSPDCAYTYRIPLETWERLAQCESGGNWAINTGNGYYGGLQFSLGSWQGVGGQGHPHQNSKWEQIHRGEILQSRQGWGAWPSCSRKLGLR